MLVDRDFKTHEQVAVEMDDGDWEENVEQLARKEMLKRLAVATTWPLADETKGRNRC